MVKKTKKAARVTKSVHSGRFLPLLIGLIVGLALALSIMMFTKVSRAVYYCDGFEMNHPISWYAGTANGSCHISNVSANNWPAINGYEDDGEVGVTATTDTMPTEQTLLDYVTDIWEKAGSDKSMYPYQIISIEEVRLDNGVAVKAVVDGGHYSRTETHYYYTGNNEYNSVITLSVSSPNEALIKKGLDVIKSVRATTLETP